MKRVISNWDGLEIEYDVKRDLRPSNIATIPIWKALDHLMQGEAENVVFKMPSHSVEESRSIAARMRSVIYGWGERAGLSEGSLMLKTEGDYLPDKLVLCVYIVDKP